MRTYAMRQMSDDKTRERDANPTHTLLRIRRVKMIINRHGATFEHAGVTYTIGASVVGTTKVSMRG